MKRPLIIPKTVECGDAVTVVTRYGQTFDGTVVGMDYTDDDSLPDNVMIDDGYRIVEISQGTVTPLPCRLFAMCENPAEFLYDAGPVGILPACARCADRLDSFKR